MPPKSLIHMGATSQDSNAQMFHDIFENEINLFADNDLDAF